MPEVGTFQLGKFDNWTDKLLMRKQIIPRSRPEGRFWQWPNEIAQS